MAPSQGTPEAGRGTQSSPSVAPSRGAWPGPDSGLQTGRQYTMLSPPCPFCWFALAALDDHHISFQK